MSISHLLTLEASVLLCLCEGAVLPDRFAHKELALDEFCEVVDLVSSLSYVYQSFRRGFYDANGIANCSGSRFLHPVLLCPAPQETQTLSKCKSAEEGASCVEDGSCKLGADLNNCPSLAGSVSVYTVSSEACKMGGIDECSSLLKALFVVSSLSVLLTFPVMMCGPALWLCVAGRDLFWSLFVVTIPALFMTIPLYLIAYLTQGTGALVGVCLCIGVPLLLCCALTGFCGCDADRGFFEVSGAENDANAKNVELLLLLNVPIFSVPVSHKMGPDKAKELMQLRKPQKCLLRLISDVPEIVCATTDMMVFGISWWAVLDLAASIFMMLYHAVGISIRACFTMNRLVDAMVTEKVRKSQPGVVGAAAV